ncbi:MAG: DUF1345 domain-containing protein [Polyangiaceae bacterium]|nr:DUF1345 domain-containing protein [Polyangiaceae bacterium]
MSESRESTRGGRASGWRSAPLLRQLRARPRLFVALAVGIAAGVGFPHSVAPLPLTRAIIGWNVGVLSFIGLVAAMMAKADSEEMARRAELEDEGKTVVLGLVAAAAFTCLAAIVGELAAVKELHGYERGARLALAGLTIVSAWAFTHLTFAIHYAHDYYAAACAGKPGGLEFPQEPEPDYSDFLYFSCIIGTSGQTADVSFTSRNMRRVGTVHCVLAFFFNATVLALTINIAASLI